MRRRGSLRLSEEEARLWAEVARSIRPLPGRFAPDPPPPAAVPEPGKPAPAAAAAPPQPARPAPPPLKPLVGLDRRQRSALKRGQQPLEGVIDLHGLTQAEAHDRLRGFLRRRQQEGARLVLVITGKGADGFGADGGAAARESRGVLRRVVPHWLGQADLRDIVLGFEEASLGHGGAGALYVRLRRAPA